jgi:hypothetical protein
MCNFLDGSSIARPERWRLGHYQTPGEPLLTALLAANMRAVGLPANVNNIDLRLPTAQELPSGLFTDATLSRVSGSSGSISTELILCR